MCCGITSTKEELYLINDENLIPYLNLIKEYKHVYKLIHDKPHLFRKQYTSELLYKEVFSKILDKYGVDNFEKEYIFSYFSLGLVAIIQKWIAGCNLISSLVNC